MNVWLVIFVVVVVAFCLFCMAIAMMDMLGDFLHRRRKRERDEYEAELAKKDQQLAALAAAPAPAPVVEQPAPAPAPEPTPAPAPEPEPEPEVVEEPVQEEIPEEAVAAPAEEPAEEPTEEAEAEEEDEGAVTFVASKSETLEEKYLALSADEKRYYDEILFHAAGKENARRFRNVRYEDVKIGQTRLVRMRIKRGVITCEFTLYNTNFKNYINENKLSVKQAPTVLKITDEAAVRAAIDSIDIVVNNIAEEKEYKKQLAREKRKAARLAAQEAEKAE